MTIEKDPFWVWLDQGIDAGYCSQPVCNTHDGLPSTNEEDAEWEEGLDPCVPAVRLHWSTVAVPPQTRPAKG